MALIVLKSGRKIGLSFLLVRRAMSDANLALTAVEILEAEIIKFNTIP